MGWLVNDTARQLYPGKETRYPLYRRLGRPQGWSERMRKISPPTGIRSPDGPARSESLCRLRYPSPTETYTRSKINWKNEQDFNELKVNTVSPVTRLRKPFLRFLWWTFFVYVLSWFMPNSLWVLFVDTPNTGIQSGEERYTYRLVKSTRISGT
jgi:hypothetical protein